MAEILLVGPDRQRAGGLRSLLRGDGHRVTWFRAVESWREREREIRPDLVVAAVEHPESVVSTEQERPVRRYPAPLLLVQEEAGFCRDLFVEERIVDEISSPFMSEELLGRADALIRVRQVIRRNLGQAATEENATEERGRGALSAIGDRLRAFVGSRMPRPERPTAPYLEVAARVADWADRRDAFELGHAERVTTFCGMMADGLSLHEPEKSSLLRAAMLHDIGKVALPIEVLHHTGPLEDSQMRLIRTHPHRGASLLRALDPDNDVVKTVLYHHERPDGTGYYGKQGDAIPQGARILAVAEVYDAMTTSRVGDTLSREAALDLLSARKGAQYDSDCVEALVSTLKPRPQIIPLTPLARP